MTYILKLCIPKIANKIGTTLLTGSSLYYNIWCIFLMTILRPTVSLTAIKETAIKPTQTFSISN